MPTYTYECNKCSHAFDVFHGMSATPRIKCEACGGSTERLLGAGAGIIFKGSGFYETDYKDKKGKPPASAKKAESKAEPNAAKKSESSTSKKGDGASPDASSKKSSNKASA